uniref:Uncharacterized protein n=1 Tax=viral metagenome TaxID=1070528 RepID=A0A6C0JCI1_9ZZZZ
MENKEQIEEQAKFVVENIIEEVLNELQINDIIHNTENLEVEEPLLLVPTNSEDEENIERYKKIESDTEVESDTKENIEYKNDITNKEIIETDKHKIAVKGILDSRFSNIVFYSMVVGIISIIPTIIYFN